MLELMSNGLDALVVSLRVKASQAERSDLCVAGWESWVSVVYPGKHNARR